MRALLSALALLLAPAPAGAAFHLWQIVEVYSNAGGSVQYVEFQCANANSEQFLGGRTLQSNANAFAFPNNLPSDQTANRYFLVATPAFASKCGAAPPDYTFAAANFMSTVADTLNYAVNTDIFAYSSGELPTDGYYALHEDYGLENPTKKANSPTNFAGQVCLPEPSAWLMRVAGLAGVLGLDRWRRRRVR